MPSRSKRNRLGLDGEDEGEEEIAATSSDPDDSESEAERGAEADDGDDEYVGESSDAGGGDGAEERGSSDSGDGGGRGDGGKPLRSGRRGVAAPDSERKSQNVDALVRYALMPSFLALD